MEFKPAKHKQPLLQNKEERGPDPLHKKGCPASTTGCADRHAKNLAFLSPAIPSVPFTPLPSVTPFHNATAHIRPAALVHANAARHGHCDEKAEKRIMASGPVPDYVLVNNKIAFSSPGGASLFLTADEIPDAPCPAFVALPAGSGMMGSNHNPTLPVEPLLYDFVERSKLFNY